MKTDIETVDILSRYKGQIDVSLKNFFGDYLTCCKKKHISSNSLTAVELLARFTNGPGKRVRGALAWFTYEELCEVPKPATAANLAIALELIQDYLLIVDDVMDRSAKRRGQPTVHELYDDKLAALPKNDRWHIANMMAINVGLLAQHLANNLILDCHESDDRIKKTLKILQENVIATCYGQIDDLLGVYGQKMPTKEAIYSIYQAKSSYYTFINSIQMGATMAGHYDDGLLNTIEDFGKPAGIAFQLQDDILGMFGDGQATGKTNVDDLREGKRTPLIIYALQMCTKAEQLVIMQNLGNPKLTAKDHRQVSRIIDQCGARARVASEAEAAAKQAIGVIESSVLLKPDMQEFYTAIVQYSVKRKW